MDRKKSFFTNRTIYHVKFFLTIFREGRIPITLTDKKRPFVPLKVKKEQFKKINLIKDNKLELPSNKCSGNL